MLCIVVWLTEWQDAVDTYCCLCYMRAVSHQRRADAVP